MNSSAFGCYWQTLFMTAANFPEKYNAKNSEHRRKLHHNKQFFHSLLFSLPCKYCREFGTKVLWKKYPLDFTSRMDLMYSLYTWKDVVNCKLGKKSPPFEKVINAYEKLRVQDKKKMKKLT